MRAVYISFERLALFMCCIFFFCSCSTTKPTPVTKTVEPKKNVTVRPAQPPQKLVPDQWADVTSKVQSVGTLYLLIYKDFSATMVLKEFSANNATASILEKEDICVLANISLRTKLADENLDRRITRMPIVLENRKDFCNYIYTEKGMLRRVIVFKKRAKVYELELFQEKTSAEFDVITADLLKFADNFIQQN